MLHLLPHHYRKFYFFQMILLLTFLIAGIAVIPVILLTYIVLFRVHRLLFKAVIYNLCYFLWIHFTYIAQWWGGLRIRLFADEDVINMIGKEHVLVLMNHKYDIDWIITWILSEKYGGLGGSQSIAKKSLKYFPIIGWIWSFNGTIFLNRNWAKDREVIANSLHTFSEVFPGYTNMLLLYPEGTRFTAEKLESSNEIARSKGMRELKHCLLPRSKGFIEIVKNLRSQVDVIYDITIGFPESIKGADSSQPRLTMKNLLSAKVKEGDVAVERILMKDLPETNEGLALWLQELFRKKDDLFDHYVNHGHFEGPNKLVEPSKTGLIIYCISFTVIWLIVGSWLVYIMWMSSWLIRLIVAVILLSIISVIPLLLMITQAEKGSSYGIKNKIH